jgi:hypothetical protein
MKKFGSKFGHQVFLSVFQPISLPLLSLSIAPSAIPPQHRHDQKQLNLLHQPSSTLTTKTTTTIANLFFFLFGSLAVVFSPFNSTLSHQHLHPPHARPVILAPSPP